MTLSNTPAANWINATSSFPCPICGKTDECSILPGATQAWEAISCCSRKGWKTEEFFAFNLTDSSGRQRSLHFADGRKAKKNRVRRSEIFSNIEKGSCAKANPAILDRIYRDFLSILKLDGDDHTELRCRGYSDESIRKNLFRTTPSEPKERRRVLRAMLKKYSVADLTSIPGFAVEAKRIAGFEDNAALRKFDQESGLRLKPLAPEEDEKQQEADSEWELKKLREAAWEAPEAGGEARKAWAALTEAEKLAGSIDIGGEGDVRQRLTLFAPPGYYISQFDEEGSLHGLQIRTTDPDAKTRYYPVSTPRGGASSGVVLHYAHGYKPIDGWVGLTEGTHKANRAAEELGYAFISVPGIGFIPMAVGMVLAAGATKVRLAFDVDQATNQDVCSKLRRGALTHAKAGFELALAVWAPSEGKGIDDALNPMTVEDTTSEEVWKQIEGIEKAVAGALSSTPEAAPPKWEGSDYMDLCGAETNALVSAPLSSRIRYLKGDKLWKFLLDLAKHAKLKDTADKKEDDLGLMARMHLYRLIQAIDKDRSIIFQANSIYALASLEDGTPEHMHVWDLITPKLSKVLTKVKELVKEKTREIKNKLRAEKAGEMNLPILDTGSHKDLGEKLVEVLTDSKPEHAVFTEEHMWVYDHKVGHWKAKEKAELSTLIQSFEGAPILKTNQELLVNSGTVSGAIQCASDVRSTKRFFQDAIPGLAFNNGFFEADTCKLVPHTSRHKARHAYDFDYDPSASSPEGFLETFRTKQWMGAMDIEERLEFLSEWMGSALMGRATRHQRAMLFYGERTQNGKTVTANAIANLVPTGATSSVRAEKFSDRFAVAEMAGKLINVSDEVPFSSQLEAHIINTMITGEGNVTAEFKGTNMFQFKPTAGQVWTSAILPRSDDPTDGFRRRFTILHFDNKFEGKDDIKGFMDKLFGEERAQIVNWAVQGYIRLVKQGRYTEVPSSDAIKAEWRLNSNPVEQWVQECTVQTDEFESKGEDLYKAYAPWVKERGHTPLAITRFANSLKILGRFKKRDIGNRYNLELKPLIIEEGGATGDEIRAALESV